MRRVPNRLRLASLLVLLGSLRACVVAGGGDEEEAALAHVAVGAAAPTTPALAADHAAGLPQPDEEVEPAEPAPPDHANSATSAPATPPEEAAPGGDPSLDPTAEVGVEDPNEIGDEPPSDADEPPPDEPFAIGLGRPTVAPELAPLPRPQWIKHRRAPRESLQQVALRYGVTEAKLREWNGLGPDDPPPDRRKRLRVWARRVPPPRQAVEYQVQEGDTWWSVALRHGVDGRDLRAYNWPSRKKMQPGAMLQVWIDPLVHAWIAGGPDPLPPDLDRQWRRGAVSIGSPNDGVLVNGLRIPETEGVTLRIPRSAYGTSHAVEQLLAALQHFREHTDYPLDVPIGSMSRPRGGPIGDHLSHQSGRDVDIKLLRRPEVEAWREIRGSRVQWTAVWQLVKALGEVDVMVIFLDQHAQRRLFKAARESGATEAELAYARRLVAHSPGHEHHLHVRFGCGPYEPECEP